IIAEILGLKSGTNFHEVAVQAHWESDEVLFGTMGTLHKLLADSSVSHLILFDEFNLTRPEYYLSRLFHAVDDGDGVLSSDLKIGPCRFFGTMNIDDSSRPPSPKVVDRCFLMELAQVSWDIRSPTGLHKLHTLSGLPGLPEALLDGANTDERVDAVLKALQFA